MISQSALAEEHLARFTDMIKDKNELYGYLGYDWDTDIEQVYERADRSLIIRVYYDNDYCLDAFFDVGEWTPESYLEELARRSADRAIELYTSCLVDSLLPESIELCS